MRGMTWDHSRGYDPLAAASRLWEARTGQAIRWDRRSLQDFESYPVDELARAYDLIVIDHPHVGQVAKEGCLLPFDHGLDAIAKGSVGGSFESYFWQGRQWALPIDAAAQVQAWVPARRDAPVTGWGELAALAKRGGLALPLRPPHSLMSLFTLCGLSGIPLTVEGPDLFPAQAEEAAALLAELSAAVDPAMFTMDPIAVLEAMADSAAALEVAPLVYGYVSYAADGFRDTRIAFADIPAIGATGPSGSALGGTGIAVSAYADDPEAAADFARWVASGAVQRDLFATHGGQPAHGDAWEADSVNAPVADFYRATRKTLDRAWLRPRHDGYMGFQHDASERLNRGLKAGEEPASIIAALNTRFRESL
ncbi:extracellular solute-binding protein [Stakelama saccharophila]|uniref:Extracellular solute-binding protein n=1 Tax=Stakelama saccharophila TaxID=3075605 RepID=A0ABZ0BA50_9SPHN|nr:extracellular solute-binding protein [Stakelama sp. W311]WNO54092.1 extracellular solute-binding protein [Stakelama sp. W311]